jgi:environmental stress-induced protein Ves
MSAVAAGAGFVASASDAFTLIRAADLVAAPWKNGGGVTREIAAYPPHAGLDAFVWRVSVADVAQPGPFSRFPGIDRTLVLLAGAGMRLDAATGARAHTLAQPLDVARFPGEAALGAVLCDGATRDFNLMVRRDAARGSLDVWRVDGEQRHRLSADDALLFCAAGALEVAFDVASEPAHRFALGTGDTLHIAAPRALACTVRGQGALLAVRVDHLVAGVA